MALVVLDSAASTMDVAREMLLLGQVSNPGTGITEPGGVLALDQTTGRGQRGRSWFSSRGESLCATYFLPLSEEDFHRAGRVAILAGAAVANALESMFPAYPAAKSLINSTDKDHGASASQSSLFGLKWPNDLLLSNKKLGGILVEVVPDASLGTIALIGIGINVGVQQFPPEIASICTSLALHGLIPESLEMLANRIREQLDRCAAIQSKHGFAATLESWRAYDQTVGRRFRTETAAGPITGVAVGVDSEGALIVRTQKGAELTVVSASATSEL